MADVDEEGIVVTRQSHASYKGGGGGKVRRPAAKCCSLTTMRVAWAAWHRLRNRVAGYGALKPASQLR